MLRIIQGELYRIRKNRLFFICLLLSTFFMFAYALTFHYDIVKAAGPQGNIPSLNGFSEFLFSDYSLLTQTSHTPNQLKTFKFLALDANIFVH